MPIQGPVTSPTAMQMFALQPTAQLTVRTTLQHLVKLTPRRLRSQHARPGPPPHPPRGCPPCWQGCRAQQRQPAAARPPGAPPAALHAGCRLVPALCSCQAATQGRVDATSNCLLSVRLCSAWAVQCASKPGSQSKFRRSAVACGDSPAALHAPPGRQCHPGMQLTAWQG